MRNRQLLPFFVAMLLVVAACGTSEPTTATDPPVPSTRIAEIPVPTEPATTATAPTTTTTIPATTRAPTTTTALADTTPPVLQITAPLSNEHVPDIWCPFEGTTEPGVELLAAGRYPIEVASDGTWSTVLRLNPGGNVATFTATDAAGNSTEARLPVYYDPPLTLRADGIGEFAFDENMDTVMAGLVALLGPPSHDEVVTRDDIPPEYGTDVLFSITAYPSVEYFRSAEWESLGLHVMFSDYSRSAESWTPGPRVFNGWMLHDPGEYGATVVTPAGATVGTSLADLEAMYGSALTWYPELDEITGHWHFSIDSGLPGWYEDENFRWHGTFDSDPSNPPTVVATLQAGYGYDTC